MYVDAMHWISKQLSDLEMFSVCFKRASNALREANGDFIRHVHHLSEIGPALVLT